MEENKIQFSKTTRVDSLGNLCMVRLENEKYDVKIRYFGEGLKTQCAENKVDFDAISVVIDYKNGSLPFKVKVNPKNINDCFLEFNDAYVGYNRLDRLIDAIHEAKLLISSIMDEICAEFGKLPMQTKEDIDRQKDFARSFLIDLLRDFKIPPAQTKEDILEQKNLLRPLLADSYEDMGIPPARTEEEIQEVEDVIQSIVDELAKKEPLPKQNN